MNFMKDAIALFAPLTCKQKCLERIEARSNLNPGMSRWKQGSKIAYFLKRNLADDKPAPEGYIDEQAQ